MAHTQPDNPQTIPQIFSCGAKANNLQPHLTGYDLEQGICPGTGLRDLFFLCSQEAFPPLSAHRSMGRVQMRPWVTAGERLSQVRTFLTADGEWFGLGYDLATSFRKRGPTSSIQSRQETEGAGDTCPHGFPEGTRLLRRWWPGQGSMLQPWKKTQKNPQQEIKSGHKSKASCTDPHDWV